MTSMIPPMIPPPRLPSSALLIRVACASLSALLLWVPAGSASAIEIPPEGACPPYLVEPSGETGPDDVDVVPPAFSPGQILDTKDLPVVHDWIPPEVWARRDTFFYEGQTMELGPCHRRYPAPPFFREATQAHQGKASLDASGNLLGFAGEGLPFAPESIVDRAPDAGARWAWNHRYRYMGSGFRGPFRIRQISRRGRKQENFRGNVFVQPLHGLPDLPSDDRRLLAGGRFSYPEVARGLRWRQFRRVEADSDYRDSDDVFVYLPGSRKVKRAPPQSVGGLYVPSYTRANSLENQSLALPDETIRLDMGGQAIEPIRRGFVGLVIRPNAYTWILQRVQDVLAPINSKHAGYPSDPEREYGPSGLSLASDRWELRRAVVLKGTARDREGPVRELVIYVDAQTLAPLYWITRRSGGRIFEVGIFMGRYSGGDALAAQWEGSGPGFGTVLPVAESFFVAGEGGGWMRESFELASEPPSSEEMADFGSVRTLRRGR